MDNIAPIVLKIVDIGCLIDKENSCVIWSQSSAMGNAAQTVVL